MLGSATGCFLGLLTLGALNWYLFPETEQLLLMAAFGSSAILIFTVPDLQTAQPWPAVTGHIIAALVGVFVRQNLPWPHFAAVPFTVAAALLLMFLTASVHPPAGGTAVAAYKVDGLLASYGYWLALFPMAAGMIVLLGFAAFFLTFVAQRPYPVRRRYFPMSVSDGQDADSKGR